MKRWSVAAMAVSMLMMICAWASAQTEEKPGTLVEAKSKKFTVTVPAGWQYRAYDKIDESPSAKMLLMRAGLLRAIGENATFTDNLNVWWAPGGEQMWMIGGIASLHRVQTVQDTDMGALLEKFDDAGLPDGVEIAPRQIGEYVGLLGGGVVQKGFYIAVAIIAQKKSVYLATIMGPQQILTPQWPAFTKFIGSLKATDLQPQKLEDFLAAQAGEAKEGDAQAEGEEAPQTEADQDTPAQGEGAPQAEE